MSKSGPEYLKMKSVDMADNNTERIAELFPNVITETEDENGVLQKGIDFDLLRQELSDEVVEGRKERYEFTWVGKKQSIVEGNLPIQKTLRPCIEDSKDWENTNNIYIEGDNLDALKLLQESYLNSVKMIYIDPPYNTGNDFIYNDNFTMDADVYDEESGAVDEYGDRMIKNNKDRGRYHSDWCSMLYPRLKLAHNLLKEDGVIFVSIDDNEVHNLRKMMDEVFGEDNFVAIFPWHKRTAKSDVPFGTSQDYEWILVYGKSNQFIACIEGGTRQYFETEDLPNKPWRVHDLTTQRSAGERPNSFFDLINPKNGKRYPANPNRVWAVTKDTFSEYYKNNKIVFPEDYDFINNLNPVFRYFMEDDKEKAGKMFGYIPVSTHFPEDIGMTQNGTRDLRSLFENRIFAFPKPVSIIGFLIKIVSAFEKDGIILDFFSGSATTAHAAMKLNSEDGGGRRFIMVQLPEPCDEKSEAYKAGFKNISEIGKERIRRAGEQIRQEVEAENKQTTLDGELKKVPDIGFRVFTIDDTNMKDVYYSARESSQETIEGLVDNVKEDRKDADLLYQVLIDWGLPLDLKHEMEKIKVKDGTFTLHIIDTDALIACFDANIPTEVMEQIAGKKPLRAVFRDGSFENSHNKINIDWIFKTIAPDTKLRVI